MKPITHTFERIAQAWHVIVPPPAPVEHHVDWTPPPVDTEPGRRRSDRPGAASEAAAAEDTSAPSLPTEATEHPQRRRSDRHSWDEARLSTLDTSVRSDSITKIR